MIKMLAGASGCCQKYDNDKKYNLTNIETFHITNGNQPFGRNFEVISNTMTWLTGLRVIGDDMYISNRGNANDYDTDNIYFAKLDILNTTGIKHPTESFTIGFSDVTFNSCDGFDLDPTGTNMIITDFNGGGVQSAELSTPFDLSTLSLTGSKNLSTTGIRAVSWNNDGTKYFLGYANQLRQFTTSTAWETSSGDTEGTSKTLSFTALSDILFNSDGTRIWLSQHSGYIHEYTLSSAFNTASTWTLVKTIDLRSYFGNRNTSPSQSSSDATAWLSGISWNDDGTKLYAITLWGVTKNSEIANTPSPQYINGVDGYDGVSVTVNTCPVIEFRRK